MTDQSKSQSAIGVRHRRCCDCFRPHRDCFCAAIPTIDNRTEVLILQHRRERFHPFNTARIVHKALRNSSLLADHVSGLVARTTLKPRVGLLYPGPGAALLADLPPEDRPDQLVIIDGTWHHTKTIVRDLAALRDVPRYRLAPAEPSRYRIRREPNAMYLSTVEATVAALRTLEPETRGLDQLLDAFNSMVERQLAHPKAQSGWRRNALRHRGGRNIPLAILGNLDRIVVAYGESEAYDGTLDRATRQPVYWAAQRLGADERFACAIQPDAPLQSAVLRHLELTEEHFRQALSLAEARTAWADFRRPGDILVVYNPSAARLLTQITQQFTPCLVLKSVDFNPHRRYSTLDELVAAEGLVTDAPQHPGRAGKRLASVVALIGHLRRLAATTVTS